MSNFVTRFVTCTSLSALAVAGLASILMGAGYGSSVLLDVGTQLNVHIVGSISSTSSNPGDKVQLVAASPLVAKGIVAVVSGAIGEGHIVSITPPKNGKAASIAVQTDWITAADGQHIAIVATKKGGPLVFGSGGPYASSFAKGKPVEVGADKVFPAYVNEQRTVNLPTGT